MHRYSVGELYNPNRTSWPEATNYNYRSGQHELLLFLNSPTPAEVEAVRKGRSQFALFIHGRVIFLLYRFHAKTIGHGLSWSDSPYTWHAVPESERTIPEIEPTEKTRALLNIVLVDASTGMIKALRAVSFSPEFTQMLHQAIKEQAGVPWDEAAYDHDLAEAYRKYPNSADMLKHAIARSEGGA